MRHTRRRGCPVRPSPERWKHQTDAASHNLAAVNGLTPSTAVLPMPRHCTPSIGRASHAPATFLPLLRTNERCEEQQRVHSIESIAVHALASESESVVGEQWCSAAGCELRAHGRRL